MGRQANSDQMNLEVAGLKPDVRGKISVNENFQTMVPHIYAAGDVIGFPALASTSMEQGPPGKLPHVRQARQDATEFDSLRDLHDPRDIDGRPNGRTVNQREDRVRDRL